MSQASEALHRASLIQDTMNTPGWLHIKGILDEHIQSPRLQLWEIMAKRPDLLTGKKAVSLAARSNALEDFKESVEDSLNILRPTPKRGGA